MWKSTGLPTLQLAGLAFLDTLGATLGEDFTPLVKASWVLAYGVIKAVMLAGTKESEGKHVSAWASQGNEADNSLIGAATAKKKKKRTKDNFVDLNPWPSGGEPHIGVSTWSVYVSGACWGLFSLNFVQFVHNISLKAAPKINTEIKDA